MLELIERHGLLIVFANVLAEQLGLPIPAVPTLVIAGALVWDHSLSAPAVFACAFAAATLGNVAWYAAGRWYGRRVLRLLCLVSLSPDSCVRQMERQFTRWGPLALVAAYFIPGLSTVARPLAGATGIGWLRFLGMNSLGIVVWAIPFMTLGWLFHDQVNDLLGLLVDYGRRSVEVLLALLGSWLAWRWWQRQRFMKALRIARITADELRRLLESGERPVIVDLRSPIARDEEPRLIPGARVMELTEVGTRTEPLPMDREIIFYCTCPNEASAAQAARQLMGLGYTRVRPLLGGMDAWLQAGYDVVEWAPEPSP
jgi:membrane protein DedA with SNARE-associated domain/rhodanese-related sulfurtransferase